MAMSHKPQYAEVVVEIANRKVDRPFHYEIPAQLQEAVKPGVRVLVPFGNRELDGYVVGLVPRADVTGTKPILAVREGEPVISAELLQLARWMALYYMCPLVTVLQAFFPRTSGAGKKLIQEWCSLEPDVTIGTILSIRKRAPKQAAILEQLQQAGPFLVPHLLNITGADRRSLMSLVNKGVVRIDELEAAPAAEPVSALQEPPELTGEQERVLAAIKPKLAPPQYEVFLLHGVTGSGKTEVYFRCLSEVITSGYQAIVLFPEISLTTHLIERFYRRFGSQVEVLHSGLPLKQRIMTLERIAAGNVSIVVGTRSAVFAPVPRLGLIIIDEEHENSYQQEVTPKYHAREVAIVRAFLNKAPLVLGSATPSLESYHKAREGKFSLLKMGNRVEHKQMPKVLVTDLRRELKEGNETLFSNLLKEKLQERLQEKEQSILFLNRRGYANLVNCRDCGQVIKCKYCDVSLTYYATKKVLKCNYCGYTRPVPMECPECGGNRVRPLGAGTEKVEKELLSLFPQARVVRIDSDTVRKKGDYERLLGIFENKLADVMIGTQMVAKGLDFPGVTLVGVILADQMLNFPDFRARERSFQLLTQVAGRAGRGTGLGEVVVQTYIPEDPTVLAAADHDYERFFAEEIKLRRLMGYPPYSHLIRILVTGKQEELCETGSLVIADRINRYRGNAGAVLLGPTPAPLTKIKNNYRWQLILKGEDIKKMRQLVSVSLREAAQGGSLPRGIRLNLDIDPLGML
jgi:primosomal protein N' (replication factor Y)